MLYKIIDRNHFAALGAMFKTNRSDFNDWTFRSAMIAACKRRDDGTFVVFPKKSFLFGDGYLLTTEQVPAFEDWYRAAMKSAATPKSIYTRLISVVAIFALLSGSLYLLAEPENAPDFMAAWPPISDTLFMVGVVAVALWIVALTRKREFGLSSKFAESFPFPDAPQIKLGLREQFAMPFRSAVATPGARWVMVLGLILSSVMVLPFVVAVIGALLALSSGHLLIDIEMLAMILTVAVLTSLPALAFISGLGYRRRFYKKTGHPLSMETLYLYETGRLSPGEDELIPERTIAVFGRRLRTSALSTGLLTISAIGLVALILGLFVPIGSKMFAFTPEGVRCIEDRHEDDDYLIRQCTAALKRVEEPHNRAKLFLYRGVSYRYTGQVDLAIADLYESIRLNPENPSAHNVLAWFLATAPVEGDRDGEKAVEHARRAVELQDQSYTRDTLAAALAELGRFEEAVEQQAIAIEMAQSEDTSTDISSQQTKLNMYQNEQPLRCPSEICD